ncbi:SDR family NAD(P)-dependent oxidoreductase [Conexibacter woesei]|uniref:SDR family NAD(P)-dependent oxidoreductase n=1 Tax=Conexibacter woesei TaxID=191495 RepID=UPI000402A68C|nr:SDR family NAD(P)-dependent oxidoreductase [Conexibacter woesei]
MSSSSKVFLVTGSSRGLGRSIAAAVVAAGHQLVATARTPESLDDLVAQAPDRVRAVALDVTDPDAAAAAVRTAVDAFGRLDVVVNNAGYADLAAVEDVTLDAFRAQIDTNLLGVVNVTKAALPVMREQGDGHIIQVSSVGGRMATPGLGAYQAAKWAVGGLSEVLAAEVGPLGIKVTVLEPGGMRTDWAGSSMAIPPVSEAYKNTVGAVAERMAGFAEASASDPDKVAQVVLQVADLDAPPVRLLIGSDAYNYGRAAWQARVDTDAEWEALSTSTDHADATADQLDPLNRG